MGAEDERSLALRTETLTVAARVATVTRDVFALPVTPFVWLFRGAPPADAPGRFVRTDVAFPSCHELPEELQAFATCRVGWPGHESFETPTTPLTWARDDPHTAASLCWHAQHGFPFLGLSADVANFLRELHYVPTLWQPIPGSSYTTYESLRCTTLDDPQRREEKLIEIGRKITYEDTSRS